MPYQIETHPNYIHIHCQGDLTLDELKQIDQKMNALLDAASHTMHYVVDIEELTSAPMSVLMRREYVSYTAHPRLGQTVTYGNHNRVVLVIVNSIGKVVKSFRYKFVDSLPEALAYLDRIGTRKE